MTEYQGYTITIERTGRRCAQWTATATREGEAPLSATSSHGYAERNAVQGVREQIDARLAAKRT